MGIGNWRPENPARHSNPATFRDQVYVEVLSLYDEEDRREDFLVKQAYDRLKEVIKAALPPSFDMPTSRQSSDWFGTGFSANTEALFWNRQVIVAWDMKGESYHQGVGVVVNPDAYHYGYGGLAERAAADTHKRIVQALREAYPEGLYLWTSAWTTTKMKQEAAA